MGAEKRSSLRRKPLSECTNTVAANHRDSSSSALKSAIATAFNTPEASTSSAENKSKHIAGNSTPTSQTITSSGAFLSSIPLSNLGSYLVHVPSQKPDAQAREDNGNKDLKAPTTSLIISSVSASGIHDEESHQLSTVIDVKTGRRRAHRGVEIVLSLRCPRKKKMKLDNGGGAKKKRTRRKHESCAEEDIERLKAYYADIDAFELPQEEVTSERDLD